MTETLSVLYVDDEPDLLEIAKIFLEKSGEFRVTTSTSAQESLESPQIASYDVIVSDYQMPRMDGITFLKAVRERFGDIPYILFTGRGREEVVIEALNEGADFYLQKGGDIKSQFAELMHKIRQAVRRRHAEKGVSESEEKFRTLVENSLDAILILDFQGKVLFANTAVTNLIEAEPSEKLIGRNVMDFIAGESQQDVIKDFIQVSQGHDAFLSHYQVIAAQGKQISVECIGKLVTFEGKPADLISIRNITYRKQHEELVQQKNRILTTINDLQKEFAELPAGKRVEELAAKKLSQISGALVTIFSTYYPVDQILTTTCIEFAPGILESLPGAWEKVSRWMGMEPDKVQIPITQEMYQDISRSIIGIKKTVSEISYGKISPLVSTSIQKLTGIDRFIHITHIIDGELYGRSVIGLRSGQPDPSDEFLESFAQIVAVSLRRQRAEAGLRESEERLRSFVGQALEGVSIVDEEGRIIEWNSAQEKITGIPRADALGVFAWDLATRMIPDEHRREEIRSRMMESMKLTIKSGTSTHPEPVYYTFSRPDGTTAVAKQTVFSIETSKGHMIGTLYQDVTTEKRADEMIKESEASYRGLFNTIQHALFILDNEGKFVDVNTGSEKMYGYPREEFLGRTPEFLSAPGKNDIPAVAEKIRKAFAGNPQEFRFWGLRKNGDEFLKDVYLTRGTYFGKDVVLAIGIDISERRQAEETLRESENKFATVFKSNPVSLTLVSAIDGKFVDVNDAFVANTGYLREEVVGRTSGELGIFPDPLEYAELVSRLQSTRHLKGMELQVRKKTGEIGTCRFSSGIILMEGRPFILSAVEDITEHRNAELAFRTITAGMVGTTGLNSLHKISESISAWLEADCVMIGEIQPDHQTVKGLSMLLDGNEVADFSYTLKGTPCENVAEKGFCIYPDEAIRLFPESRDLAELNIRGYAGTPLRNARGETIGILCILTRKPLVLPPDGRVILDIIAVKAAAEIERKRTEDRLTRINKTLLHLGTDHRKNIGTITRLCGELLDADCVLYNRLDSGLLCVIGKWNCPSDLPARVAPEGHICYDVIREDLDGPLVVCDLQNSRYAQTDPNVAAYGLKTYIGHPVRFGGVTRGSLCAVYTRGFIPTVEDQKIIGILSSAIAQEEERREDHQALRESEEKYRLLADNLPDFVFIHSGGKLLYVNRAVVEVTGMTAAEVTGHSVMDFIAPESRTLVAEKIRQRSLGEQNCRYEAAILVKNGEKRYGLVNSVLITYNGLPASLVVVSDITDRKAAEQDLKESGERFRMLLQHVPSIAIQGYNLDGITQYWNEAAEKLYGYSAEEAMGKNLIDLIIPPDMKDQVEKTMVLMEKTGQPIPASELSLLRKNGSRVEVFSHHALVNNPGSGMELFCIDIDLTERKKAEEALRQAHRKLNLLSGITRHDIRNQIMALQGFLEISRESLDNPARMAEFIEKEKKIAGTISSQISFAKVYEELGVKAPVWQNVSNLIGRIVPGLPVRGIRIDCSDPGLEIFADPLLEKVFYNLIDNALRYGGETMTAIRIHSVTSGKDLVLIFEDDGAGIGAGNKEHLFEQGFGKNTGLGLFLSREILSITGITIAESGEPGKGARFEITVPAGQYRGIELPSTLKEPAC